MSLLAKRAENLGLSNKLQLNHWFDLVLKAHIGVPGAVKKLLATFLYAASGGGSTVQKIEKLSQIRFIIKQRTSISGGFNCICHQNILFEDLLGPGSKLVYLSDFYAHNPAALGIWKIFVDAKARL